MVPLTMHEYQRNNIDISYWILCRKTFLKNVDMQSEYKFILLQCRSIKTTCINFKVFFQKNKIPLTQEWTSNIRIKIIEFVQIAPNTLFSFPIGIYNFHDDTAVVRNLQDVTNSSAHHNPRMTRIVQTVWSSRKKHFRHSISLRRKQSNI